MGKFESERKTDLCTLSLIRLADKLKVTYHFYLLHQFQSVGIGCLDCCVTKESEAGHQQIRKAEQNRLTMSALGMG